MYVYFENSTFRFSIWKIALLNQNVEASDRGNSASETLILKRQYNDKIVLL